MSSLPGSGTFGTVCTALVLIIAFAMPAPALAGVGDHKCTDCDKVYYGNPNLFKDPCEVSSDKIYKHIAEYKEILEKALTDKDVRYHFLMKKASERFNDAVKKMAKDEGYGLVAEIGVIKKAKKDAADVPNGTDKVIKNLK